MATTVKKQKKTALSGAEKKTIKRKSLLDYAKKFKKKPLFSIAKEDEDLIFGSNMMVKLMQEK